MVVTVLPAMSATCIWHEKARLPSMCTMQAPHRPVPHPYLVPVSLRSSRSTHNKGVAGGASVDAGLPFTVKFVAIVSSLCPLEQSKLLVSLHQSSGGGGAIARTAAVQESRSPTRIDGRVPGALRPFA